jgi:DNA repair protein RadC
MKDSFTIHDLPVTERPRERMLRLGAESLSTHELLALVLGRGIKGESVWITAQKLITKYGSLNGLANASIADLSQTKGIGIAKATQIKAAIELGKRLDDMPAQLSQKKIKCPEDVIGTVKNKLKGKKKEHFIVISLDTRNHPIDIQIISIGSLNSSIVHPREVFKEAISSCAASVIFVHNHPSGDPEPSEEDIKLTKRLIQVGEILGIEVLDHIIVCDRNYVSMKAKKLFSG